MRLRDMSKLQDTIAKHPVTSPAQDYFRLRRDGIGFIEQMGSMHWTDYNTHDPGITILEALCFAITDLAYRIGWDMKDLLTPSAPTAGDAFPGQSFFKADEILTINPWTPDDFRRLLIDLSAVRDAWVQCRTCACDFLYYVWCVNDEIKLARTPPDDPNIRYQPISSRGLLDILLEFEEDPELGDLNDRKIERTKTIIDAGGTPHDVTIEMRFPAWGLRHRPADPSDPGVELPQPVLLESSDFIAHSSESTHHPIVARFGAVHNGRALSQWTQDDINTLLRNRWNEVFFVTLNIEPIQIAHQSTPPGAAHTTIVLENVAIRVIGNSAVRKSAVFSLAEGTAPQQTIFDLRSVIEDATSTGMLRHYRSKLRKIAAGTHSATTALMDHRNLDEDFCHIRRIEIEDVAVCADIEVAPDADIERVQAGIWFSIEQYFNPPVPFHSLEELLSAGGRVEELFDGPALTSGFIDAQELANAQLKRDLRVSDIIHGLMNGSIPGLVAVNNLLLTKYDSEGKVVSGDADPAIAEGTNEQVFDSANISASWLMRMRPLHLPRLYTRMSRFIFFKNGLPFRARQDEARDTLLQLRGEADRPKIKSDVQALPVPAGTYRNAEHYFPVQYSFPLTYGIGTDGLASHVSDERRAQAKQLKAYLMVFEQLLCNAHAQLEHTADLFSLDPGVTRTYFFHQFSETEIVGFDEMNLRAGSALRAALGQMTETVPTFLDRRNRFLDHLMARFAEGFNEFALLLSDLEGQQRALEDLINDKTAFLQSYPAISHDRAKGFNYRVTPGAGNVARLQHRINLLLGRAQDDPIIIIEHLLLRPKFPGDALYPFCTEEGCCECGSSDPYSFRLTVVVPGGTPPFAENLSMRRFAERTIRQEIPSHLLGKICWINDGDFATDPCDPVVGRLEEFLSSKGFSAENACDCARKIYDAYGNVFEKWFVRRVAAIHSDAVSAALDKLFSGANPQASVECATPVDPAWLPEIQSMMIAHFRDAALYGRQFKRFERAWKEWLHANAAFNWGEERLLEKVQLLLSIDPAASAVSRDVLCECAASILVDYGTQFTNWLERRMRAGKDHNSKSFTYVLTTLPTCSGVVYQGATVSAINRLLHERYSGYTEVSYRLRIVLDQLALFRNIYPGATLHDCDDGSDQNPVRLGSTALGNYRLRPAPSAKSRPSATPHAAESLTGSGDATSGGGATAETSSPKQKSRGKKPRP